MARGVKRNVSIYIDGKEVENSIKGITSVGCELLSKLYLCRVQHNPEDASCRVSTSNYGIKCPQFLQQHAAAATALIHRFTDSPRKAHAATLLAADTTRNRNLGY